jgi:cytoskeletal protein CcmA (bactofilin family)
MERMKFSEFFADIGKRLHIAEKKSKPEATQSQGELALQVEPSIEWQSSAPHAEESAMIGPTIKITGNLTSEEDLVIDGHLDGRIEVRNHNVTVGKKGQVKADIYGKIIAIEGTVEGNLYAEQLLIIKEAGIVLGKITSPRVSLEDGSIFNGTMEMSLKQKPVVMTIPEKSITGIRAT